MRTEKQMRAVALRHTIYFFSLMELLAVYLILVIVVVSDNRHTQNVILKRFWKKKLERPHWPQERTEYTFKLHKSLIHNKTD